MTTAEYLSEAGGNAPAHLKLPLRVLVADDHRLFRQGLIGLMRTRPDLVAVVGEADTGRETLCQSARLQPDVVLLDIHMPDGDGLQVAAQLRRSNLAAAVIILTASELEEHLFQAIRLGAAGYLLKSMDAEELFELLAGVAGGEAAITRATAARVLRSVARHPGGAAAGADALSEREIEVLQQVARGASNAQIAEKLHITINTVKVHLRNILAKLQVDNRTQATAYAVQSGLVASDWSDTQSHR
jgi:DNA-binding NarL/FixJ family response regulator